MTSLKLAGAVLAFSFATQLCPQSTSEPTEDRVCAEAVKTPIPQGDTQRGVKIDLRNCPSWQAYYGIGRPIDFRLARDCAYALRGENDPPSDVVDSGILSMIYADGKGVTPSLDLAIKFACEMQGEWDDGAEIVNLLDKKRKAGATEVDLDICDHVTGREVNYACEMRDQDRANKAETLAEKRIKEGNNSAQAAAFSKLLQARKTFLDAHGSEEPNGTVGSTQAAIQDDIDTERLWVRTLNDLAAGKPPRYTAQDFSKADAALNAAYRSARQVASSCDGDYCATTTQLLQAERAWLAYREAWVAYGGLRWPAVSPDSWRTMLTLERTQMLGNE